MQILLAIDISTDKVVEIQFEDAGDVKKIPIGCGEGFTSCFTIGDKEIFSYLTCAEYLVPNILTVRQDRDIATLLDNGYKFIGVKD